MEQERNIANIQLNAISRPGLLQSAAQENNRLADYVSQISEPNGSNEQAKFLTHRRNRKRCNCNARYANFHSEAFSASLCGQTFGHLGLLRSSITSAGWHHRKCPMYRNSPTIATARFSIGICGALLNQAIEASVSIIHGADGSSISPKLHCSRLVSRDCEAFMLVSWSRWYSGADENWEMFLYGTTREIERLFQVGQATPYDVDLKGNTFLHVRDQQAFSHCAKVYRLLARHYLTRDCLH